MKDQINWLSKTRARCKDVSCLEGMYEERIKYLDLLSFKNPPDDEEFPLMQSTEEPDKNIAQNAQIVLISGYEPSSGSVNVTVDRPNTNIILVLSSYETITWKIHATPTTNIKGILVGGYKSQQVFATIKTPAHKVKIPYAYEENNINFKKILVELNRLFGVDRIDYFNGAYKVAQQITVPPVESQNKKLSLNWPPIVQPITNFSFQLLSTNNDFVEWTLKGPKDPSKDAYLLKGVAVSTKSKLIYKLQHGKIEAFDKTGTKLSSSTPPQNLPEISWDTDITYDSKRDLLSIISFGGEGYLYRYFPTKDVWLDAHSAQNHDISSIYYDKTMDRYVGWGCFISAGEIVIFNGEGTYVTSKLIADKLEGYGRSFDRNNEGASPLKVIAKGDSVALIAISGSVVTH
ncbi:MAG: hypothetical protein EOP48_25170, partial [Sphingobacteriales bacterium]